MDVVAQDLNWLLGCTLSTIPTANFSLCTKPTALSAKIKRNKFRLRLVIKPLYIIYIGIKNNRNP